MSRRTLWSVAFALALSIVPPAAFAQAAAESVLLHGAVAGAGAKAGSALGSALNQTTKKLGSQLSQQTSPGSTSQTPVQRSSTVRTRSASAPSAATSAQGPMIASIQGAHANCASTSAPSSQQNRDASTASQNNCAATDSARHAQESRPRQEYRSVITLPQPK